MRQGLVQRVAEAGGRGRPSHRYSLTEAGRRSGGANYDALAQVLWDEIRGVEDPRVRRGLLKRISDRMWDLYQSDVAGRTLHERMASWAGLMSRQNVPFEVSGSNKLPVLTALACPYPDLAEHDRGVCAMEKMMLSEVLGEKLTLSACRLDGATCCTFETSGAATPSVGVG
jgi:predicted ArsR family transcriptional regulator